MKIIIIILILLYTYSNLKSKNCILDKIYYFKNVLSEKEYNIIKEETKMLDPKLYLEEYKTQKRHIVNVDKNSVLYNIFYGDKFLNYLANCLGFKVKQLNIVPIDYRKYMIGDSMNWHRDTILSNNNCPQIEVVFTIDNNSDSTTIWIDDKTGMKHEIISEPNSIMITQGGSVYHKVTQVMKGYRSIIKIAYDVL